MKTRILLAAALLIGPSLLLLPSVQATDVVLFEDFEAYDVLDVWQPEWASRNVAGSGYQDYIKEGDAQTGSKAWQMSFAGATVGGVYYDISSMPDICDNGRISWWINATAIDNNGQADTSSGRFMMGLSDYTIQDTPGTNDGHIGFWLLFNNDADTYDIQYSMHGVGTVSAGATLVADIPIGSEWTKVVAKNINCADGTATFQVPAYLATQNADVGAISDLRYFVAFHQTAFAASPDGSVAVDNIDLGTVPAASSATASVSVSGLVGFDVDVTGNTILARLNDGTVAAYNANSLTQKGVSVQTNCNRVGGVAALRDVVSYLHCDSGDPGDVDELHIRSSSLGAPLFSELCEGNYCYADLADEDLAGAQDDQLDIGNMLEFPYDYSFGDDSFLNQVGAAWAYTTTTGHLGVMTYVWTNNAQDFSHYTEKDLGLGQAPDAICTTVDGNDGTYSNYSDGISYVYAVSNQGNPRGYLVSMTGLNHVDGDNDMVPTMDLVFSGSGSTSGAIGVGCGEGVFALITTTTLTVWDCRQCNNAQPYIVLSGLSGVEYNGLDVSDDGRWLTFMDGDGLHVMCIQQPSCDGGQSAGTIVFDGATAGTTFKGMGIHGAGSYAWAAFDDLIEVWAIYDQTTGTDVSYDPNAGSGTGTGSGGGSTGVGGIISGPAIDAAQGIFGNNGASVLGWITTLALLSVGFKTTKNFFGAALFGGVGLVLSLAFGFLTSGDVFLLLVICVVLVLVGVALRK